MPLTARQRMSSGLRANTSLAVLCLRPPGYPTQHLRMKFEVSVTGMPSIDFPVPFVSSKMNLCSVGHHADISSISTGEIGRLVLPLQNNSQLSCQVSHNLQITLSLQNATHTTNLILSIEQSHSEASQVNPPQRPGNLGPSRSNGTTHYNLTMRE